eukprot:314036-Chlamydomonas_euryale.AAC.1
MTSKHVLAAVASVNVLGGVHRCGARQSAKAGRDDGDGVRVWRTGTGCADKCAPPPHIKAGRSLPVKGGRKEGKRAWGNGKGA